MGNNVFIKLLNRKTMIYQLNVIKKIKVCARRTVPLPGRNLVQGSCGETSF